MPHANDRPSDLARALSSAPSDQFNPPSAFPSSYAQLAQEVEASNVHSGGWSAIMAQAGPITDVTSRLFVELQSKNEEARVRAANGLYDNVLATSRGACSFDLLCF